MNGTTDGPTDGPPAPGAPDTPPGPSAGRTSASAPHFLAERFEAARPTLRAAALRMVGPGGDAEDAVQDAWLRLSRADARGDVRDVANLQGWLTTVVARVCLDVLRARAARREAPLDGAGDAAPADRAHALRDPADAEHEAQVADAVGLALLVVLDRLAPAERVAFVLHDTFDLPFEAIAPIVGRTPAAARQLASRARRRVRGTPLHEAAALRRGAAGDGAGHPAPPARAATRAAERSAQRRVVDAYLAASRAGDVAALVAVLAPDVVLRADPADVARGAPAEVRGAAAVSGRALAYAERAPFGRAALVDGAVGVVVAPRGRLVAALRLTVAGDRIAAIDVVTDPARLARLDLAVLDPSHR